MRGSGFVRISDSRWLALAFVHRSTIGDGLSDPKQDGKKMVIAPRLCWARLIMGLVIASLSFLIRSFK